MTKAYQHDIVASIAIIWTDAPRLFREVSPFPFVRNGANVLQTFLVAFDPSILTQNLYHMHHMINVVCWSRVPPFTKSDRRCLKGDHVVGKNDDACGMLEPLNHPDKE